MVYFLPKLLSFLNHRQLSNKLESRREYLLKFIFYQEKTPEINLISIYIIIITFNFVELVPIYELIADMIEPINELLSVILNQLSIFH